jgi:hypothetical protein
MRAFHLVAHHRSFARAAETLLITPSGLRVLIRKLDYGHDLLEITEPSLSSLDAAVLQIEQAAKKRESESPLERFPTRGKCLSAGLRCRNIIAARLAFAFSPPAALRYSWRILEGVSK